MEPTSEELVNMRPGEPRRSLERWQARAKDMQRLQDKKEHAWDLYSRVPNFRLKNKENFEEDFKHRAVYDGKVNERKLQEWIDEMQPKVHAAERQLETREKERMNVDGVGGTLVPTGDEHGRSCFSDDGTLVRANHLSLTVSLRSTISLLSSHVVGMVNIYVFSQVWEIVPWMGVPGGSTTSYQPCMYYLSSFVYCTLTVRWEQQICHVPFRKMTISAFPIRPPVYSRTLRSPDVALKTGTDRNRSICCLLNRLACVLFGKPAPMPKSNSSRQKRFTEYTVTVWSMNCERGVM